MSTPSTYMGFPISTIGTDSGLNWETNLNAALSVIDQHNHSPGQGQLIQPNGLNINSDLSFNSNNATNLRTTRFTPQISPISNTGSDTGELYVSGNELYYNDVSGGNQVQLTDNGTVNATSSGISSGTASASFSAGTLNVKSSSTSFGSVAMLSAILSNSGNLSNQLTLQAPVLSGSITETLPAIPLAQSFMAIDPSGNMSGFAAVSGGITGAMIASQTIAAANIVSNTITASQIANLTITNNQISDSAGIHPNKLDSITTGTYYTAGSSTGSFSTTSASFVTVTGLDISPTVVTTRPGFLNFTWDQSGGPANIISTNTFEIQVQLYTGASTVLDVSLLVLEAGTYVPSILNMMLPITSTWIGFTGRMRVQVKLISSGTAQFNNMIMTFIQQ